MYAVIQTGGKQYKVAVGDKLKVEKLAVDAGAMLRPRVLMVANGSDIAAGAPAAKTAVSATVLSHGRGEKIRVFKMKRRKGYRRTIGHRQSYTEIQITAIGSEKLGKQAAAKRAAPAQKPAETPASKAAKNSAAASPAATK